MSSFIENYDYPPGSNGSFSGYPLPGTDVQKEVTGCTECLATRNAFTIRTDYDKYFLEIYNNKAQSFETDLLHLQFPDSVYITEEPVVTPTPSMTPDPKYYRSSSTTHLPTHAPRHHYRRHEGHHRRKYM
jgi:hypothetical protein